MYIAYNFFWILQHYYKAEIFSSNDNAYSFNDLKFIIGLSLLKEVGDRTPASQVKKYR